MHDRMGIIEKPKGWVETLGDLAEDYTEIALDKLQDRFTDDEVMRSLPVVKTLVGVARAGLSIRDRLFITKVRRFIESRDQHSADERETFVRALDTDPRLHERLQGAIILLLDQFDDMDKSVLFARAFSAFVRNEIESFYHFKGYGEIIKAANVVHLQ
jgi:hypothetical protein